MVKKKTCSKTGLKNLPALTNKYDKENEKETTKQSQQNNQIEDLFVLIQH